MCIILIYGFRKLVTDTVIFRSRTKTGLSFEFLSIQRRNWGTSSNTNSSGEKSLNTVTIYFLWKDEPIRFLKQFLGIFFLRYLTG